MPSTAASLASLVESLDATARTDVIRRQELIEDCEAILDSHIGRDRDLDIGSVAGSVRRRLLQQPGGSNLSLRFSNLVSRLVEQPVLSRKPAVLLFLQALASTPSASNGTSTAVPPFLPSLATNGFALPPSSVTNGHGRAPSPLDRERDRARSPNPISPRTAPLPHSALSPTLNNHVPAPMPVPTSASASASTKNTKKSKAALLAEWREEQGKPHLPEAPLIRDALYLLQGISGTHVQFAESSGSGMTDSIVFVADPKYIIPPPTKALIHRLSELGYLYARVSGFVKEREGQQAIGMIEQSLCHHLQAQLTEYYRLVAILESQMNASSESHPPPDSAAPGPEQAGGGSSGLTLRRLNVWIDDWRLRMRMMSVCVENCKDAKGGALVSLIHANTNNGDPFVRDFTDRLLEDVSKPFFSMLQRWLFSGDLHDPHHEFFVRANPKFAHLNYGGITSLTGDAGFETGGGSKILRATDVDGEVVGGQYLWESQFEFVREMVPSFLSEEFGRKIYSTGKSLNFIRYSCDDSEWVATRGKLTSANLVYSDIAGLERSIDSAYRIASQRLFEVFFNKYHLIQHMTALKGYLMLGHGDFADHLMESLGPSLSRPAHTLYLHHLTATLETAIRYSTSSSSSSSHDGSSSGASSILRRLDARMLDHAEGEIGWEVFTLVYKVDAPIDTVLDPGAMLQYQRLFGHLWRMKRVDSALGRGWERIARARKGFTRNLPEYIRTWHEISIMAAEMNHFVRQMQAYSQLEVIACQWEKLMEFTKKQEGDLDALIDAHRTYLNLVVSKVLLLHPKREKETDLLAKVRKAFAAILDFRTAMDNFYNHCLGESARRDAQKDAGRGVAPVLNQRQDDPALVDAILKQVAESGTQFTALLTDIVNRLYTHPDSDCRFLAVRLSFNEFYKIQRRERDGRTGHTPGPQSQGQGQA